MNPDEPERTPLSDQDKIRLKRIEKLSQASKTTALTPTPSSSKPVVKPIPAVVASRPVAVLPPRPTSKGKGIIIHPAGHSAKLSESFEDWEHGALSRILNLTLDVEIARNSNWSIVYLKELATELLNEAVGSTKSLQLTSALADPLLLARLSLSPDDMTDDPEMVSVLTAMDRKQTLFEYLSGAWKRERSERTAIIQRKNPDPKYVARQLDSLNTLKTLLVSYIGLVLMDPTMFPQAFAPSKLGPVELLPLLVPSQSTTPGLITSSDLPTLLNDLASRFTPSAANDFDESTLEQIIGPLLMALGFPLLLNGSDLGGGGNSILSGGIGWRESLAGLVDLMEVKGVAGCLPGTAKWATGFERPQTIETSTILGPWLRLSTFSDSFPGIAKSYFPSPSQMGRGDIESAFSNLRGTLRGVQISQLKVITAIIKASPTSREAMLEYFGRVAKANVKRGAIQVDARTVSSHGFMCNLFVSLLGLATPFMDAQYSKIDKIDPLYFKYSDRIDIKEVTKMSATQQESDAYYSKDPNVTPSTPNFISEIFFLASTFLHIGPLHTMKEHKAISRKLGDYNRGIAEMEADSTWRGTPQEARQQAQIDQVKSKRDEFDSELHAMEVQILDPEYLTRSIGFMNLVMTWLVRMVDPTQKHPSVQIGLPLPEATPEVFKMLPEYLIEDITEFLTFVSKYAPNILADSSQNELMTFMLVFLSTPYMKNPFLKGQFVEIMYYLTRPTRASSRGSLGDVINFHPLALKNLMFCLCNAYIEIENTGSHSQFYEKFNTRYYITQLFKLVWENPSHREALRVESLHIDRYTRFVNLLMNDTGYLLEEAIIKLGKISEIQKQMADPSWGSKPSAERQEIEKNLREHEGGVRSDLELGIESLRLIKLFTAETKKPFLSPEIIIRLVAMLNYQLDMLAGPKCQDLKVSNPESYKFRPKELLSDVLQVYLNLGGTSEFRIAMAGEGRSYSKDLFVRADRLARKMALKVDAELNEITEMVIAIEAIKKAEEEDDAMGEVPDEYLDPLTYEIMRDPVLLPSSKAIVDRSTIKQHHLSDATDPFNRVPLIWEELTDAVELKAEIEEFLRKRRAAKIAGNMTVE